MFDSSIIDFGRFLREFVDGGMVVVVDGAVLCRLFCLEVCWRKRMMEEAV